MTKRIFAILLCSLFMIVSCSTAFAITGNGYDEDDCDYGLEFRQTGYATFILDSAGKICGVLKPNEDLKKIGYQSTSRKAPKGLEDGKAIRRRVFAKVSLDDDYRVIEGGKKLEVTISITNVELVQRIVGYDLTPDNIIDATIYSPYVCYGSTYASHMFLPQGSNRVKVGTVTFKCGGCLDLYAGNFDDDCDLELGFRAVALKEPEVPGCIEPPDHCGPCHPPCGHSHYPHCGCQDTDVIVTTTTTVVTTVTTTTTVEVH